MYASHTLQRPQQRTRPVYLAQGDSGTDTETERQVISARQSVPRVKRDQHQRSATAGFRLGSSAGMSHLAQSTL